MNAEEFVRTVQNCGYGTKNGAKKYVELNPKDEYGSPCMKAICTGKESAETKDSYMFTEQMARQQQ